MTLQSKLKISFDFDGVFLSHFLNRHWVRASSLEDESDYKKNLLNTKLDTLLSFLFNSLRTEIKGSKEVIPIIESEKLYIITSRRSTNKAQTIRWLKKRGLLNYFDDVFLNPYNLAPYLIKEKIIKKLNIDMHIDDDYDTLVKLTTRLPNVQFVYFNSMKTPHISAPNIHMVSGWEELMNYFKSIGIIRKY